MKKQPLQAIITLYGYVDTQPMDYVDAVIKAFRLDPQGKDIKVQLKNGSILEGWAS